jgi:hypothetical protein
MMVSASYETSSAGPPYRGRIVEDKRVLWRCNHHHLTADLAVICASNELRKTITLGAQANGWKASP